MGLALECSRNSPKHRTTDLINNCTNKNTFCAFALAYVRHDMIPIRMRHNVGKHYPKYSALVWYRYTRCFMEASLGRDWDRYRESAMPRHEDMLTDTTCAAAPVETASVVEATPYNSSGGPIVQLLYNYCTTIIQLLYNLLYNSFYSEK